MKVEASARMTGRLCSKKQVQASGQTRKGRRDCQGAEAGQSRDEEAEDIPDTANEKPVEVEVVAVGPDARNRRS